LRACPQNIWKNLRIQGKMIGAQHELERNRDYSAPG
jgi:hypothetical protein